MLKALRVWALIVAMLAPGMVQAQGSNTVIPLLVNASATGNLFAGTLGGNYQLNLAGTVGGSTVTVTASDSSGVQQTVATFTAVGTQCIALPARASLQGVVIGGSPSGLYLNASGVQYCPTSGASGPASNVNIAQINGAAPSLTNPIFTAYAEAGDTTGTFTNATQATAVTATNADGYATALVSINGTYGTATGTFQASDDGGVTFYTMSCVRSDGTAVETGYTTLTNTNRQWFCPVSGNDSFRVQSSAVASGTVNVRISISAPPTNSAVVSGPTGAGSNQVQGAGASGVAAVGNPVGIGAVVNVATPPGPYITGTRADLQADAHGSLRTILNDNNGFILSTPAYSVDGQNASSTGQLAMSWMSAYNGGANATGVDRVRTVSGAVAAGTGDIAVANAAHTVAQFTTVVGSGVSTLLGKASAGNFYTAYLTNTDTVTHWLWIVNTTSAPVNGSFSTGVASGNLQDCVEVAAGQTGSLGGLDIPEAFATGVYFANSTTGCGASSNTLTLSTTGLMHGLVK